MRPRSGPTILLLLLAAALQLAGCDTLFEKRDRFLEGTEPDRPGITVPPPPLAPGEELPGPKVVLLLAPGLDLELAERGMRDGFLPNLRRLRTEGTLLPTGAPLPPSLTTAAATLLTGQGPARHGVVGEVKRVFADGLPQAAPSGWSVSPAARTELFPRGAPEGYPASFPVIESRLSLKSLPSYLDEAGLRTLVLRLPVGYPALTGERVRVLAAGAIPDASFGLGAYVHAIEDPELPERRVTERGGIVLRARPSTSSAEFDVFHLPLSGPSGFGSPREVPEPGAAAGPAAGPALAATVELTLSKDRSRGTARSEDHKVELRAGTWSEPLIIRFEQSSRGAPARGLPLFGRSRLYLRPTGLGRMEVHIEAPDFVPAREPAWQPISYPAGLAGELSRFAGPLPRFSSPFPGAALVDGVLDGRDAAAALESSFRAESKLFETALLKGDFDLLVQSFALLEETAQIGPGANEEIDFFGRRVPRMRLMEGAAAELDRLVGAVLAVVDSGLLGPDVTLVLSSPYGAAPATRFVDLNRLLESKGYLFLSGPPERPIAERIDWSRTRAYALGYGGIYVNLAGREPQGIVRFEEASRLLAELNQTVLDLKDPVSRKRVVRSALEFPAFASGVAGTSYPDLLVGLESGYAIDQSAAWFRNIGPVIGSTGSAVGCGSAANAPGAVPGLFAMSRVRADKRGPKLEDVAATVLALLEVRVPAEFEGVAGVGERGMGRMVEEKVEVVREADGDGAGEGYGEREGEGE